MIQTKPRDETDATTPAPQPLLDIVEVSRAFGDVTALDDVSLTIAQNEFFALLGPSGCGKTTLLRSIAGFEQPDAGAIMLSGQNLLELAPNKRPVNLMFQSYALFPHMTVRENVEYGLRFSGFNKKDMTDRARAGLELVGLAGLGDRLPSQLSGGQQQRVAVARALVLEPQVLLFDEPLSNLDARLRRRVREEIREIQQKLGLTVVYVTHDQEEALAVSDRIIVMNDAVIAQEGTPRDLYEAPANAFVADFIGEANIFECQIESLAGDIATVAVGPVSLRLPARGRSPGAAKLAARPGRLEIHPAGTRESIPGRLEKATYVGSHLEFVVVCEFGEVFVVSDEVDSPLATGQEIGLKFAARGPVLIAD